MSGCGAVPLLALLAPTLLIFMGVRAKGKRTFRWNVRARDPICYEKVLDALDQSGAEFMFQGRLWWATIDKEGVVLATREFTATSYEAAGGQKFRSRERSYRFAVILAKKIELRRRMRSSRLAPLPRSRQ